MAQVEVPGDRWEGVADTSPHIEPTIGTVRSRRLVVAPDAQGDYLSGLLIGHELNALDAMLAERGIALADQPLHLRDALLT